MFSDLTINLNVLSTKKLIDFGLYADSKQNLDLNLGIAPPANSDIQMMNMHLNGSDLEVQPSWDDMPVDKSAMVRLKVFF